MQFSTTKVRHYLKAHFQSLASISIRGLSVLAGFVISFLIGNVYGPVASGQYALITQTGIFLSIVAVGGMDLAVVRRFSATMVRHIPLSRAAVAKVLAYCLGAAAVVIAALVAGGIPYFTGLFGKHYPQDAVILLCLVMIARSMTRLTAAILRSQNAHIVAQTIEVLVIPSSVALLMAIGVLATLGEVLWATALIGLAAGVFGVFRSFMFTRAGPGTVDVAMRSLFRTSLPLWLTGIALNVADWYGLATAASVLGVYEAGLFRVSFQIAGALSFVAMGLYNVFAARISAALEAGDIYWVAQLSRSATRLAIMVTLLPVILLVIFAETLLAFVGPEFVSAAPLLQIMLIGQFLYVATGPAGLVLAMMGHERLNFLIAASVTGVLLIAAPLAAHAFGLIGLAVAMALVPIVGNVANLLTVRRLEHINIMTGQYVEPDEPADREG